MSSPCLLQLSCESADQADKIARALLEKRLIACAKFIPISSTYRWQGDIETSKEILLLMESVDENFSKIEDEVARLHSYETFVLHSTNMTNLSAQAKLWLDAETKQQK